MTPHTTLIERFFDKQLSATEIAEVAILRKTNAAFEQEYLLFEKAHKVARLYTISRLKEQVRAVAGSKKTVSITSPFGWMKIAASITLLAVVGLGFYAQQFSDSNIYKGAYTPAADYITNLDESLSPMEKAMEWYNVGDFAKAIDAFAAIENEDPKNQEAKFYLGQSLMQKGEIDQAVVTLSEVSGDYRPEAQWYVALAYLSIGNETATLSTLETIIKTNADEAFVQRAQHLKNKLTSPFRKLAF